MAIRVECSTPGLEANWIEVSEVWTRRELQEFATVTGDAFWALWARKVSACCIVDATGEALSDPAVVQQRLDDLDIRLLRWLSAAVLSATQHLLNLGEASARLLLNGVVMAVPTKMM